MNDCFNNLICIISTPANTIGKLGPDRISSRYLERLTSTCWLRTSYPRRGRRKWRTLAECSAAARRKWSRILSRSRSLRLHSPRFAKWIIPRLFILAFRFSASARSIWTKRERERMKPAWKQGPARRQNKTRPLFFKKRAEKRGEKTTRPETEAFPKRIYCKMS